MYKVLQRKIWKVIAPIATEVPYRLSLLKHSKKLPRLNSFEQEIVHTCRREGVCVTSLQKLGLISTEAMLESAQKQLNVMEIVCPTTSKGNKKTGSTYPQIFTVTDLQDFSAWGNEASLLKIAECYIGLPTVFQGVHLRRDFANDKPVTTELWHQDLEDRRMLKAIIYLNDVSEEHGPFEYIPKSKLSFLAALRIRLNILFNILSSRLLRKKDIIGITSESLERIIPKTEWQSCPGAAGTVVFVDPTAIFHHGKSRKAGRSTLFFVYTSERPLRPECCTQYKDETFARPLQVNDSVAVPSQI